VIITKTIYIFIKKKFNHTKPFRYFHIMSLINIFNNNKNLQLIKHNHKFVEEKQSYNNGTLNIN